MEGRLVSPEVGNSRLAEAGLQTPVQNRGLPGSLRDRSPRHALTVEEVTRVADLEDYRAEWQDLVAQTDDGFFQSYEWLTSWIERFWKDRPLAFLFVRDEGKLIGLAPLLSDRQGQSCCPGSVVLAANEYAYRAGLLCRDGETEMLNATLRHLRASRGGVRLVLKNVPTGSPLLDALPRLAAQQGLATFVREASTSPVVRFPSNWDAYLRSRSPHVRSELRRKIRRIEGAGTVKFVAASTPADCARAIEDVIAIERQAWKLASGGAMVARPERERFYRELARSCAARGWLRMYLLYLNSKPAAYLYGFAFRNEYYAYQTSFDDAYRHLSPGTILFERALQDACRRGLQVYLGAMPAAVRNPEHLHRAARWKSEFSTELHFRASVCVFSRDQIRCQMSKGYHERAKPFVKTKMPFLVKARRQVARLVRGIRS